CGDDGLGHRGDAEEGVTPHRRGVCERLRADHIHMHLAPPADQCDQTGHVTALDIAGHDIVHAREPRPGQSAGAHRLFPPFHLTHMVLLVSGSTCLAPCGPQMVPSRVPINDTMTFLMLFFSSLSCWFLPFKYRQDIAGGVFKPRDLGTTAAEN